MNQCLVRAFESPDEVRQFEKGRLELVRIGGMTLGRATYEPGWIWSEHVGKAQGLTSCAVEHLGMVLSGRMAVRMDDGRELIMGPGDIFSIDPGHDAWVHGDQVYVSIHFEGADDYARSE